MILNSTELRSEAPSFFLKSSFHNSGVYRTCLFCYYLKLCLPGLMLALAVITVLLAFYILTLLAV